MAHTERIWRGSDTRPKRKTNTFLRASRRSTVGNLYQAGWRFVFFCCRVYCFIAEWHIHSQVGLEMYADTVQHGSFWGFQVFFCCLDASLSRDNTIHTYDWKVRVFTGLDGEEDVLERRTVYQFGFYSKQSRPVRSKIFTGRKITEL